MSWFRMRLVSVLGTGDRIRAPNEDHFLIGDRVSVPKRKRFLFENLRGRSYFGLCSKESFCIHPTRLQHITRILFVDNKISSFTSIQCKRSLIHSNCQSITSQVSVDGEDVTKAFELFLSTDKDENLSMEEVCNIYIEKLCASGKLSEAAYMLGHFHHRQIKLGLNTYNILLTTAGDAANFNLFSEIFKVMLVFGILPDLTSYINLAKVFWKVTDSNLVLKFIREVSELTIHRDPIVVNRIIFITAKSGQINKSVIIYEELKNQNCKMDKVTFNTILGILGKAGFVDRMLSEFKLMKDLGYTPDIVTYNTLINCLRGLGRLELCRSFAREMVERGIEQDLRTYTALIDGHGRAGQIEDALNIFGMMKESQHPSIYVYRALISDLKKAGKFELALKLLTEMNSNVTKLVGPGDFKQKSRQ